CNALANVKVGDGVTAIGDSAFENCTHLASVLSSATQEPSATPRPTLTAPARPSAWASTV
ncbi:MAG: hypothetical protein IIX10_05390, partial [Clostridia bacterium]|nr:hypothetical protein [Clostridia bacterium]